MNNLICITKHHAISFEERWVDSFYNKKNELSNINEKK